MIMGHRKVKKMRAKDISERGKAGVSICCTEKERNEEYIVKKIVLSPTNIQTQHS